MHNLVVGITNSGKTWLTKYIAQNITGANIVVYDPLKSHGWPDRAIKFTDPKKFFEYVNQVQNAYIFCDEAKNFWIDGFNVEAEKLLTQSRHSGQLVFLIAQRAKMIPPTARAQCSQVYAFRQNVDDSIALSQEYTPTMRNCTALKEHEFIASNGFQTEKMRLNFTTIPPTPEKIN